MALRRLHADSAVSTLWFLGVLATALQRLHCSSPVTPRWLCGGSVAALLWFCSCSMMAPQRLYEGSVETHSKSLVASRRLQSGCVTTVWWPQSETVWLHGRPTIATRNFHIGPVVNSLQIHGDFPALLRQFRDAQARFRCCSLIFQRWLRAGFLVTW